MKASGAARSRVWRNTRARWVVFSLGIALALAGAWNVVRSAPGLNVFVLHESMASSPDANARPSAPDVTALKGTILSTRPADIRTIIADARGRQRLYALGGETPDRGKVIEIHRDYIVLLRDGRSEMLEFSWNSVVRILERTAHGALQAMSPGDDPDNLREAIFTRPELLLDLIGASPVLEGERFIGFRVIQAEDSTFLESLGLKPGDILTAVNGVPLNTPDYGAQLLGAMSGTGKLTFTVRRGREVLVLNY